MHCRCRKQFTDPRQVPTHANNEYKNTPADEATLHASTARKLLPPIPMQQAPPRPKDMDLPATHSEHMPANPRGSRCNAYGCYPCMVLLNCTPPPYPDRCISEMEHESVQCIGIGKATSTANMPPTLRQETLPRTNKNK